MAGSMFRKDGTITSQIEKLEKETARFRKQLLEYNHRLEEELPDNEKLTLKKAAEALEEEISDKEKELTYLRKENRKTTLAAIFIFTLVVLFYVFFISSPKHSSKIKS